MGIWSFQKLFFHLWEKPAQRKAELNHGDGKGRENGEMEELGEKRGTEGRQTQRPEAIA